MEETILLFYRYEMVIKNAKCTIVFVYSLLSWKTSFTLLYSNGKSFLVSGINLDQINVEGEKDRQIKR
jgi:hypothetical protein